MCTAPTRLRWVGHRDRWSRCRSPKSRPCARRFIRTGIGPPGPSDRKSTRLNSRHAQIFSVRLFFFKNTATTEIYPLSLHDALPISLDPVPLIEESPLRTTLHPYRNRPAGSIPFDWVTPDYDKILVERDVRSEPSLAATILR